MAKPLLEVRDLSIEFKTAKGHVSAVEKVSFGIGESEIFALVGESGSGKSTTAMGIMRLLSNNGNITEGTIHFNGEDLVHLKEREMVDVRGKKIGMIFQNPLDSLNPVYTVGYQISEAIILDKIEKVKAWKMAQDILKDVRISDGEYRMKNYPFEFSGGMRQRVMIGMMISRKPKLLIADEPTTALDVTIQSQILDLLLDLKENFGKSILLITHDFGIVAEIADKIAVMYAGNLVETGTVFQIFDNALHPYTKLLLKALPSGTKEDGLLETIPGDLPDLRDPPRGCRFCDRCPEAEKSCSEEAPILTEVEGEHFVACHKEKG